MMTKKLFLTFKNIIIGLIAFTFVILPFWLIIVNSFKTPKEALELNIKLPTEWNIVNNYLTVIIGGGVARSFLNTLIVTSFSVTMIVFLASFAAWVFARKKSKVFTIFYFISIAGILIHPAIIASIKVLKELHIYGNLVGVTLYFVGIYLSFAIFFMTGFIKTIPLEIEEAARIDGCSHIGVFFKIVFPLLKPVITTVIIFLSLMVWNNFIYPFYFVRSMRDWTLTLSLFRVMSKYTYQVSWELVFADVIIVSLPLIILFFFLQKRIISGLMSGAIRG